MGHFYFDLWSFFLNKRLEGVRKSIPNIKDCSLNLSEFAFSTFISQIVEKYHRDIESFVFISKFIEYQFERTQKFYSSLFFSFFVCQVLFVMQLAWFEGSTVIILNSIQLGIQIILFEFEFIQMKDQKFAYFASSFNWFNLIHFSAFVAYFIFRLKDTNSTLPTIEALEANDRTMNMQAIFTLLNILLIFTGTLKFMQYIRVYTKIGWIVELIS